MESTDVNCLVEMGFSKSKVDEALTVTKGQGIQAAIDWLFAHPDEAAGHSLGGSDITATAKTDNAPVAAAAEAEDMQIDNDQSDASMQLVACLVCDDCGKKFRSESDAQFHAVKSKHQNFSESTDVIAPLTEEEKKEQAAKLQEKLVARRKQREEEEKKLNLEREKSRRKTGKEVTEMKQKHDMEEMKKLSDQRRREKLEEKALRQKLKEQIAEDRANFKAAKQQKPVQSLSTLVQPMATSLPTVAPVAKEYGECRVQFRLTNGSCLTAKFRPEDRFSALAVYVTQNRTDGDAPFKLMTTFPKKEFTNEHMELTLTELGLVPSSVIIVAKS